MKTLFLLISCLTFILAVFQTSNRKAEASVAAYDIVIRNGIIVDGTGSRRYKADVGIVGDRIARVGSLGAFTAKRNVSTPEDW